MTLPRLSWVWVTAYDWRACARAIARAFDAGDEHVIGWSFEGITWGGGRFTPPHEVQDFAYDVWRELRWPSERYEEVRARMRFVLGDFYTPALDTATNETCERNALTHVARPGWIVTMDSDEEIVNLPEFLHFVGDKPVEPHLTWLGTSCAVYKVIGDVALVAMWQATPVMLGRPGAFVGPRAPQPPTQLSPMRFINWFLAQDDGTDRSDDEVRLKLESTCHLYTDRADVFARWKATTLGNFTTLKGIGGNYPGVRLQAISVADLRAGRWAVLK